MSCLGDPLSDIGNFFLIFLKPRSLVPINAEPALRGKLNGKQQSNVYLLDLY